MNILLLGSGGREDALAWRLRQSPSCGKLVAAPGNPGRRALGRVRRDRSCAMQRPSSIWLGRKSIELVVIGPEAPLVAGVADALRAAGHCGLRSQRRRRPA